MKIACMEATVKYFTYNEFGEKGWPTLKDVAKKGKQNEHFATVNKV